jgi:putative transposase
LRAVIRTFEKTQGWYYYQPKCRDKRPRIKKPEVLDTIRKVLQVRPATYGYRRISAILKLMGVKCNPKTVNRYMALSLWLSTNRHKRQKSANLHEGAVAVPEPNCRWASDITVIKAWNGEKGRLAVVIDCADRQILAYRWDRRITGNTIIGIVKEALNKRFGKEIVPVKGTLEFLSDNGPEYIEKNLRDFLENTGFRVCNTPVRSPESNGIAEGFFKSFKRDYVYQNVFLNFEDLLDKIGVWIEDYNLRAPHSALGMLTPAKFYENWKVKK